MVDERIALAFSVLNNPGVYALLVGSGISRGAEIPTGRGVIDDLIEKVAKTEGKDSESDLWEWYEEKYGETPSYDDLMEQLAPSEKDRQALLEPYFEPTEEEREQGVKTPSRSHESIAWLVKESYINVIVTTNFDRLLEQALKEKDVTPTVIAKPSDAEGAAPLAHEDAVVLKINGDYKSGNLKNTAGELDSYESEIEHLIKQVLEEYGLIVCGWSGANDMALRDLILASENRRYSMYWAAYNELDDIANELVEHRNGNVISIDGAGEFFHDLKERVRALEDAGPGAPLSKEIAQSRTKRYLTREEHVIDLDELIYEETESLQKRLADGEGLGLRVDQEDADTMVLLDRYMKEAEVLASIFSTCAYYGPDIPNSPNERICKSLIRLAKVDPDPPPKYRIWRGLPMFPVSLLVYSMGVAAAGSRNWDLIYDVLTKTDIRPYSSYTSEPLGIVAHPYDVGEDMSGGTEILKDYLRDNLSESLQVFLPGERDYDVAFDEFDLLADLVLMDLSERLNDDMERLPRQMYRTLDVEELVSSEDEMWGPIEVGFFEGSVERAGKLVERLNY